MLLLHNSWCESPTLGFEICVAIRQIMMCSAVQADSASIPQRQLITRHMMHDRVLNI